MLDTNTDRMVNAIGMLILIALVGFGGILFFGKGSDNFFTQIVDGADGYIVDYDLDKGEGDFHRDVVEYPNEDDNKDEENFEIPTKEPIRSGYTFTGWEYSSHGKDGDDEYEGNVFLPGSKLKVYRNIKLTAQWKADRYDVEYDLNGGEGNIPLEKVKSGSQYEVVDKTPINKGKYLVGWVNLSDGETYQAGDTVHINKNTVFKAKWDTNIYDVTYDMKGGKSDTPNENVSVAHNKYLTIPNMVPKKKGYVFHGWKSSVNGEVIDAGDSFQVKDDTKLTAEWSKGNNHIRYDLDGGRYTEDPAPETSQYGNYGDKHQVVAEKPYKAGYVFNGWDNNRNDKTYESGSSFTIEGDTILTAKWSAGDFRVNYDLQGGDGSFSSRSRKYNEDYEITEHVPKKNGFEFNAWRNSQDNQLYKKNESFTVQSDVTLSADWVRKMYPITFELNGGDGIFEDDEASYESNFYITTREPSYDGNEFQGWLNSENGRVYKPGEEFKVTGKTRLTAQWEQSDYVVKYDVNKGIGSYSDVNMTHGRRHVVSKTQPTREGYVFDGWKSDVDGEVYQPGDEYEVLDNTTLTAQWSVRKYDVKYDLNGGNGNHKSETAEHGVAYQISADEPTRDGYTFEGWTTNIDNKTYNGNSSIDLTSDVTFKAKWSRNGYTIEYELNDGVAPEKFSDPQSQDYGKSYTIYSETPTRRGYIFDGWANNVDGKMYNTGDKFKVSNDTTLSAEWSIGEFDLTFDLNGGEVSDKDKKDFEKRTMGHQDTYKLSDVIPVNKKDKSQTFTGWLDSESGSVYEPGEYYTMDEDATLVAQWGYDNYFITYDENGGSIEYDNGTDENIFEADTNNGHEIHKAPTLKNYVFVGWESDVDSSVYKPGEIMIPSRNTTLTAKWKLKEYTLRYDLNGGSANIANDKIEHDVEKTITKTKPTKKGYSFKGWKRSDNGKTVQSGGKIKGTSDITLEAQWGANSYTVTYNTSTLDNSSSFNNDAVKYDQNYKVNSKIPKRQGYEFKYWVSSKDNKKYNPGDTHKITGNATLTPKWESLEQKITYDLAGGSNGPANTNALFGENYTVNSKVPTRSGYEFVGWKSSQDSKVYKGGTSFKVNGDVILKAEWERSSYTVRYDINDPNNKIKDVNLDTKINHGDTFNIATLEQSGLEKIKNYKFTTWSTKKDGSGENYKPKSTYSNKLTGDITLYAQWEYIPDGYVIPDDDDFEWIEHGVWGYEMPKESKKGYYRYTGSDEYIMMPNEIKGQELDDYLWMFRDQTHLKGLALNNPNDVSLRILLDGSKLKSLELTHFDMSNITSLNRTFENLHVDKIDLSPLDTGNVVNMVDTFDRFETDVLNVGVLDTSNVVDMSNMFSRSKINKLDLKGIDTRNVESMNTMFSRIETKVLDVSPLDTSKVESMRTMFDRFSGDRIDGLSSLDTRNVESMRSMFSSYQPKGSKTIDISSFDISENTVVYGMFRYVDLDTVYVGSKEIRDKLYKEDYGRDFEIKVK